jgi:hypothetical protein
MKTDLKVELFLIHQTYFADNHGNTSGHSHRRSNQNGQNMALKIGLSVFHYLLFLEKNSPFPGGARIEILYGTD